MALNGLLLIDKPQDWTSHDVVAKVRRLLHMSSVGHSGTLDPFASGLMVLLLGHGTKLSDFILSKDKTYEVEVRLGIETDTLDRTGTVLSEKAVDVSRENLLEALKVCQGEIELEVPIFSAIKVKGKKLYDYARSGQDVVKPMKSMSFYNLELLEFKGDRLKLRVSCSKGSYIRSWAQWLGRTLGCGATAQELRRVSSEPFTIENAISLGQLEAFCLNEAENQNWPEQLKDSYIPLIRALPEVRRITVSGRDEKLLMNGQVSHEISSRLIADQKEALQKNQEIPIQVISSSSQRLLALLETQPGKGLKIRRVFKN